MIQVFDKAKWQIENGIEQGVVLKHFRIVFEWLLEKGYLNEDGKEVLGIGIDPSVSLSEKLLTAEGIAFLEKYYDTLIEETEYNTNVEINILNKYYDDFKQSGLS